MYNIWCELKKESIILGVLGIGFSIGTFFIEKKISLIIIILTLLIILTTLKMIFKYLSLKKNGKLIENVPYTFKPIGNNEKVLIIDYQLSNGNTIQLFKKKRDWGNVNDVGTTSVLINTNNPKQYYIFDPSK